VRNRHVRVRVCVRVCSGTAGLELRDDFARDVARTFDKIRNYDPMTDTRAPVAVWTGA
jgi:hypothetical protein